MTEDTKHEDAKIDEAAKAEEVKAEESKPSEVRVNDPNSPEAIAAQHEAVDEAKAKLDEENAEGHAVNMQKIEDQAMEANARTEHADDPRANHVPTGKENNHNTPHVLPDGTKVWN